MTTAERYAANILDTFSYADDEEYREGMIWYNKANAFCWELDFLNPKRAAGVIAALSPMLRWNKNKEYAAMVYRGETPPYLPANVEKAFAIRNGWHVFPTLSGPKVTAFYHNIVNPYSDDPRFVTVDKHALDIANGFIAPYKEHYRGMRAGDYLVYQQAYVIAAQEVDILPLQMQAVTWITHKNMKWGK